MSLAIRNHSEKLDTIIKHRPDKITRRLTPDLPKMVFEFKWETQADPLSFQEAVRCRMQCRDYRLRCYDYDEDKWTSPVPSMYAMQLFPQFQLAEIPIEYLMRMFGDMEKKLFAEFYNRFKDGKIVYVEDSNVRPRDIHSPVEVLKVDGRYKP